MSRVVPPKPSWRGASALYAIRKLGLSPGLKLALDAGDADSYTGTGQSWLDRAGNGYDFFRGANNTATTDDPSFNGTAGRLSSGEYWSFDGGDYFTYDGANEAWMNNLHKAGARFTLAFWSYLPLGTATQSYCGTQGSSETNTGISLRPRGSAGNNRFVIRVGNAGAAVASFGMGDSLWDQWALNAISIDATAGTYVGFINGVAESGSLAYSSPATGNANSTMQIGARGGAQTILASGARFGMFMGWEGAALTQGQLTALFDATRGRFGV